MGSLEAAQMKPQVVIFVCILWNSQWFKKFPIVIDYNLVISFLSLFGSTTYEFFHGINYCLTQYILSRIILGYNEYKVTIFTLSLSITHH